MELSTQQNNEKEEIRTRIIERASALFFEKGIKVVKMDDIAHELAISKRTIYELFSDKEQLLTECLKHIYRILRTVGKERIRNSSQNTLDVILLLYYLYFEMIKRANKNFFIDLMKYPQILKNRERKEKSNNRKFKAWIQQGIKEGLFREDTNSDILMYILKRDLDLIVTSDEFSHISTDELGKTFILFYLRGIATIKGQEIIENFIKDTNNKEIKQ